MIKRHEKRPFDRVKHYQLLAIAKHEMGWDDEFYYGIWLPMQGASLKDGKYSATTLSDKQLLAAVEVLKDLGFKVTPKNGKAKTPGRKILADDGQSKKIRALWLEMHGQGIVRNPSEASLAAYVKRLTGIDALQWLSTEEASTVIETLKKWQKRVAQTASTNPNYIHRPRLVVLSVVSYFSKELK